MGFHVFYLSSSLRFSCGDTVRERTHSNIIPCSISSTCEPISFFHCRLVYVHFVYCLVSNGVASWQPSSHPFFCHMLLTCGHGVIAPMWLRKDTQLLFIAWYQKSLLEKLQLLDTPQKITDAVRRCIMPELYSAPLWWWEAEQVQSTLIYIYNKRMERSCSCFLARNAMHFGICVPFAHTFRWEFPSFQHHT